MTETKDSIVQEAASVKDPHFRKLLVALVGVMAIMLAVTAGAAVIVYNSYKDQAQDGTNLAKLVDDACADPVTARDLKDICGDAKKVIDSAPAPVAAAAEEIQDPEIQDPEIQDPENQEAEDQEAERQNPERDGAEVQDPEIQNPESQEPEVQEPEVSDGETQDPEVQDEETQDPEVQESEEQEPERQDEEVQDEERQDEEIQDPEIDDPDPNSLLDFQIRDECNPGEFEAVYNPGLAWERAEGIAILVLSCTSGPLDPPGPALPTNP